jgi:hypothetical protein
MFVAATLYFPAGTCPIHIRNMSLSGALVEGAVLPGQDVPVTLRRGSLQVAATIVWRVDRKAGIAFGGPVRVADWMSRTPPSHQAQVDEMVRGIRAGGSDRNQIVDAPPPTCLNPSLEAELSALKAELVQLETGLTSDIDIAAAHPEIQLLDIALQRVERMLGRRGF